ncbi:MAG: Aminodeoxychorismate synthase component 2 [Myxococcota bacterium]|nr:Aminodeoxychorismate synthase component 2 [Myxococcota bacterium]
MIAVLDNLDSFTFNLVQQIGALGYEPQVFRCNQTRLDDIAARRPQGVVVGPGPGHPADARLAHEVIGRFRGVIPVLGVCLGHQVLAMQLGGTIVRASQVMHGKTSPVRHRNRGIFRGLPNPFPAMRYHSLLVQHGSLSSSALVTASTGDGEVMGVEVEGERTFGVQFHPESLLTPDGTALMKNFLSLVQGLRS